MLKLHIDELKASATMFSVQNGWVGQNKLKCRCCNFYFYFDHKNSRIGGLETGLVGLVETQLFLCLIWLLRDEFCGVNRRV